MGRILSCLGSSCNDGWESLAHPRLQITLGPRSEVVGFDTVYFLFFFLSLSFSFSLQIASLVTVTFMGKQRGGSRGDGGSCIMFLWKQGLRPRLEPLRGRCPISGGREDAKKQGLFATGQDPVPPETIWCPSHEPRRNRKLRAILRESSLCSSPHTAGYWRDVETGLSWETLTGSAKGPPYPWVCGYRTHAQVSNTIGFNQDDYSCTRLVPDGQTSSDSQQRPRPPLN